MGSEKPGGFSLIELVIVIAIVSILAYAGAQFMFYAIQNTLFVSGQLNLNMVPEDALRIMIEGDSFAGGLRFSRLITEASFERIRFVDQDGRDVTYFWDQARGRIYRSVDSSGATVVPYYIAEEVFLSGADGRMFSYYNAQGRQADDPSLVRYIELKLVARLGDGVYSQWRVESAQSSAVSVKKYQ